MTDGTNTPAETLAEGTQAKNDTSPKEYVTLAPDDDEDPDETEDGEEAEGEDTEQAPAGDDGAHKRRPGSAKWRERAQRLERELAEARRAHTERPTPGPNEDEDKDLVEPKEADFDNWVAYQRALQQYDSRKAYREERRREAQQQATGQAQREHDDRLRLYNRNLDQVRDRVPDFDRVIADARDMPISDAAQELILESPKGPLLAYFLAKNPEKLAEINRMTPTSAAREIGRLEARIRSPQPKARTNAPAPRQAPKGSGGSSPKDPSRMSMAEFSAWREKGGG